MNGRQRLHTRCLTTIVIILLLSILSLAQQPTGQNAEKPLTPPAQHALISDSVHAKAVEMARVMGTIDTMVRTIKLQIESTKKLLPFPPKAQDDFAKEFLSELKREDLEDIIVPVYEQNFTEAEMDQIIAFYKSPIGQTLLAKSPELARQAGEAGRTMGGRIGYRVGIEIGQRLRKGEYGPWTPPVQHAVPPQTESNGKSDAQH